MGSLLYLGLLLAPLLLILYKLIFQNRIQLENLPPSPPSLPIIGHFHLLKRPIHHALHNLSNKYGPILFLRLGSRPVLVVSTSSVIEECFTNNDIVFANRPLFPSRKLGDYNFTTVGISPYGQHWRNLRRFMALEIFSSKRLKMSSTIRAQEIQFLVKQLLKNCQEQSYKKNQFSSRDIKSMFYMLTFNIMINMVAGERYFDDELGSENTRNMYKEIKNMFTPITSVALGDFFPSLRWLCFHGVEKKMQKVYRKRDEFMQDLINKRRNSKSFLVNNQERKQTIIDVMLSLQESEPDYYTDNIIKGIILVMLIAGADTSASTMGSAALHLISNPEVFKKAREEIDTNVEQSRLLDDADLVKLPYLHCIINEALRLGSIVPIIPPRESSEVCTVGGYDIPRGTMLFVNVWALHRDPNVWADPNMFKPERFLGSEGEMGRCRFIPFGSGRRQCPGAGLAMRIMALSLGTLIQCFEWEQDDDESQDTVESSMNKPEERSINIIFRSREALVEVLAQL